MAVAMKEHRGFTLMEILLTLTLVTTLSLGLYPVSQSIASQQRLRLARESFLAGISSARFRALAGNLSMRVVIHDNLHEFAFTLTHSAPSEWQTLPPGVRFLKVPRRNVTFYSRGYAAPAGTFVLENASGRILVVVSASGRVRWQEAV